jgi:2Fe-2S ferredoxin
MPKITYIDSSGTDRTVDAELGSTVMETAIRNNIPGIEAECGGACACATCHVYVDAANAASGMTGGETWLRLPSKPHAASPAADRPA